MKILTCLVQESLYVASKVPRSRMWKYNYRCWFTMAMIKKMFKNTLQTSWVLMLWPTWHSKGLNNVNVKFCLKKDTKQSIGNHKVHSGVYSPCHNKNYANDHVDTNYHVIGSFTFDLLHLKIFIYVHNSNWIITQIF